MRILLTGSSGQVGWELQRSLCVMGEVVAPAHADLDLADPDAIARVVRVVKPDIIVNPAAHTAVDRAESEPELAMAINGTAPGIFANEAKRLGALLVHYSTDYVFDGSKAGPYLETDTPNPLGVYGKTKLVGEQAIVASGCRHLIFRTSWVYGLRGRNFLLTMQRLLQERKDVGVVADQIGSPTWSRLLAAATHQVLSRHGGEAQGLYHMTCGGAGSWFDFTVEIARLLQAGGATVADIRAITTADYPTPAQRPANSLLDGGCLARDLSVRLPDWRQALALSMGK
jgi:dTDP-4-dehydrorhamnose reductase